MRLLTKTDGIMRFLATQPTDKICAVLAHAEDGKLSYVSCCCLIGSFTADHSLIIGYSPCPTETGHYFDARKLPYALAAEQDFRYLDANLSGSDTIRRRRIIPLLRYELRRRELRAAGAGEAAQPTSSLAEVAQ